MNLRCFARGRLPINHSLPTEHPDIDVDQSSLAVPLVADIKHALTWIMAEPGDPEYLAATSAKENDR